MLAQIIHRVSKIDYLSNVSNVIKGENTTAMTVHSHANYHVPKHPDASPKGLGTKVLSMRLIIKTNREILAESESFWIRPSMTEGFL